MLCSVGKKTHTDLEQLEVGQMTISLCVCVCTVPLIEACLIVCLSCGFLLNVTRVWLQENFSLSVDFLGPVFGAVSSGQQTLEVSVQLSLLRLSQFLLCKLEQK